MIIPYMANYYDEEYNLINFADFNETFNCLAERIVDATK